jgi:hypothetical protein
MNIPPSVARAVMNVPKIQKLLAFMMFMPSIQAEKPYNDAYARNLELGVYIQRLVAENKIRIGTFDENFKLDIL